MAIEEDIECPKLFPRIGCDLFSVCNVKKEDRKKDWTRCPNVQKGIECLSLQINFEINKYFGVFHEDSSKVSIPQAPLEFFLQQLFKDNEELLREMLSKK